MVIRAWQWAWAEWQEASGALSPSEGRVSGHLDRWVEGGTQGAEEEAELKADP